MSLFVRHPVQIQLLLHGVMLLQTETHRIPSRHDIIGDDTAERVGHDGHFASPLFKLRVPGAEEHVQSVKLLGQALGNLDKRRAEKIYGGKVCERELFFFIFVF